MNDAIATINNLPWLPILSIFLKLTILGIGAALTALSLAFGMKITITQTLALFSFVSFSFGNYLAQENLVGRLASEAMQRNLDNDTIKKATKNSNRNHLNKALEAVYETKI